MGFKIIRLLLSLLFTFLLIFLLNNRLSEVVFFKDIPLIAERTPPPFGKFLNPFAGFWTNAEPKKVKKDIRLRLEGLKDKVEVAFDDRLVPHIFAKNDHDIYFTQGYITAKYRLWQMEFITHFAGGRISEIVGEKAIDLDKFHRRIGMVYAAEKTVEEIEKDETSNTMLEAYVSGINTYIENLSPSDYPIEYKLLNYAPEKWTKLKTALLLKYMAKDLSYKSWDEEMTNILHKFGKETVDELFGKYPSKHDPIIPPSKKFKFRKKLDIPKVPKSYTAPRVEQEGRDEDRSGIGSNNWAISGEISSTGYPMLANDPHLSLKLPSIWFEIQLVTPDLNVYGASLPGAPNIISGFNQNVAWGVTNVASDVLDWYQVKFTDSTFRTYQYGDETRKLSKRIEKIKVRGGKMVEDIIYFTHQGPIVAMPQEENFAKKQRVPVGAALRWVAHEPSNEMLTFYKLNRAGSYKDYRKALETYVCPAQNFVFADIYKNIAITPQGKFPLKWDKQGMFILDGSNPEHTWTDWIPLSHNPTVLNPERGFVSSANQFSVADSLYPYYLNYEFATFERGMRINQRLAKMDEATMKDMQNLQNDNYSLTAKEILPTMLKVLKKKNLNNLEKKSLAKVRKWNYYYNADKIAPTIFELWWNKLYVEIWKDEFGEAGLRYPKTDITMTLIVKNDSLAEQWFDNKLTAKKEKLRDIVSKTFKETIEDIAKERGQNMNKHWEWGKYKATRVTHLADIPAFSIYDIYSGGDGTAVNATKPNHGPSWRMIVALGRNPKARVIYPGGQSGNPGSFYYANMIEDWAKGKLVEAVILKSSKEENKRLISRMRLYK